MPSLNIIKRVLRNWISKIIPLYYEFLSYALLIIFLPFKKKFNKSTTFKILEATNKLYIFYLKREKIKYSVLRNLETYRNEYDKLGIELYDLIINRKDWLIGKKILDIGCFVGGKAEVFIERGAKEVVGIDLSMRGINVAKKFERDNLKFLNCSTSELLELGDYHNSFDTVVAFTVFEHIDNNQLLNVLNDSYDLLKNSGVMLIVYNYYFDRYGGHLGNYIYFPWPQCVFKEAFILEYCDKKLENLHKNGEFGYFPKGFKYSVDKHNADCYMALNKLTHEQFNEIIKTSKFKYFKSVPYSQTKTMKILSKIFPKSELFKGSYLYLLKKNDKIYKKNTSFYKN